MIDLWTYKEHGMHLSYDAYLSLLNVKQHIMSQNEKAT